MIYKFILKDFLQSYHQLEPCFLYHRMLLSKTCCEALPSGDSGGVRPVGSLSRAVVTGWRSPEFWSHQTESSLQSPETVSTHAIPHQLCPIYQINPYLTISSVVQILTACSLEALETLNEKRNKRTDHHLNKLLQDELFLNISNIQSLQTAFIRNSIGPPQGIKFYLRTAIRLT